MWKGLLAFVIVAVLIVAGLVWLWNATIGQVGDWADTVWTDVTGVWNWMWSWLPWNDSFRGRRETFASPRARMIAAAAAAGFADGKHLDYRALREQLRDLGGLDPVEYDDVRKLARKRRATPEAVQRVLAA